MALEQIVVYSSGQLIDIDPTNMGQQYIQAFNYLTAYLAVPYPKVLLDSVIANNYLMMMPMDMGIMQGIVAISGCSLQLHIRDPLGNEKILTLNLCLIIAHLFYRLIGFHRLI